jgi:hypothetical protein
MRPRDRVEDAQRLVDIIDREKTRIADTATTANLDSTG